MVVDALSRKERVNPKRIRAINMILQSSIKDRILTAHNEAVDEFAGLQKGLDEMIELRNDRALYYLDRIWVPLKGDAKVGEGQLIGHELVQETTEKILQIKDRLKVARDRQKSYADKRRKPLEFSVGDYVLLKVSPWIGVVRFGKKGKLAPRFVGPFEIIEKVSLVAYRLDLHEELNGVHDMFHVSNLKKCLADPTLKVPLDEIQVDAKLNFVEEPVEILEREFKKLKHSRVAIVKVRWNSKRDPEFTWEREDQMKLKSVFGYLYVTVFGMQGSVLGSYFGALTDEAVRNGTIKKVEKRGNVGEPSKDRNGRDANKRTRTVNAFATTMNPVKRENTGTWPKCTTCNSYHAPGGPYRTCYNYNRPSHLAKDCRSVPRNVNPINVRNPLLGHEYECGSTNHVRPACPRWNRVQGPGGNCPNQVVANNDGQGRRNQRNQARGRAFMLGAEEARQDSNIITGTFTLNKHFATTLFDSGADYSFVSTTFLPLLGLEPSDLGFKYEIEIASGQLVEFDKVIKGCKLEIEGHIFDIDLIPFGHGSFDVIIDQTPILKEGMSMILWAIEMEHYLEYIDNEVWKVIQNGNSKKRISTGKDGIVRVLSPVTAAEIQAVEKERKAKNILLMAIPKEHMRRFHGMDDAKEIWEAIRTRFGGNANSKKMQKAIFKQQFEAFKISNLKD
ncbi:putative reverse transcriptase domain-containing protein [Tanacetum coccineum]